MLSIPIFAIAYTLKGGQFPVKFGKALSAGLIFAYALQTPTDFEYGQIAFAGCMAAAWLLAVAPSMGEEAGAIGRYGHWWGDYKDAVYSSTYPSWTKKSGMPVFDRLYGILKGVQRGAWMGAVFTVAGATTLSIPIMAIGFPLAHFIGQEIYYSIHKRDDWKYAEVLVGSLLGLSYFLSGDF